MLVILLTKTIVPGWAWWHTLSSTQEAEAGRIAVSFRPDPESKTDRQREREIIVPLMGFSVILLFFRLRLRLLNGFLHCLVSPPDYTVAI